MTKKSLLLQLLLISLFVFLAFSHAYAAIPVPQGMQYFSYSPRTLPVESENPADAIPIGLGSVAKGGALVSIEIRIGSFLAPVDIYFAVYAPTIHPEILFLRPDGSLKPLTAGIVPTWGNTLGDIQYKIGNIQTTDLPDGTYTFYLVVFPANAVTLDNSYIWETKFTICPEEMFEMTYGGLDNDSGYSVQRTSDCGYIIVGSTISYGAGYDDVYLIKTDSDGDALWTQTYGGASTDSGRSVQQTSDGGYIIVGYTASYGAGESDVYLIKTDSDGDVLWTQTYGGAKYDYGYSVQQTSDGGYIILGYTGSYGAGESDVYLIKTDSDGDALWTQTYGGAKYDYGSSIQQTSDGGYIIVGLTYSYGAGEFDVYLIKTDSDGDVLWTQTYGGAKYDSGRSVQQTSDGGYIILGNTDSYGAGLTDVYLIKTDSDGDAIWVETHGGADIEQGFSIQQTSDGGYIITGYTFSYGVGKSDVYLIKTDSGGEIE